MRSRKPGWKRFLPILLLAAASAPGADAWSAPTVWLAPAGPASIEPPRFARSTFDAAEPFHLLLVGRGFAGTYRGFEIGLRATTLETGFPDAWRFDAAGCQANRLSVRLADSDRRAHPLAGARPYTNLVVTGPSPQDEFLSLRIGFEAVFDDVVAEPESTYVLAQFEFDFSSAARFASTPDSCGCAGQEIGIWVTRVALVDGSGTRVPAPLQDWGCWGWNDTGASYVCAIIDCSPGPCTRSPSTCGPSTPARARSWGSLKNVYRLRER